MDLNEIKQYTHKVKTIQVTNKNKYSLYNNVVFKATILSSSDEVIRFSLDPNDNFIDHQQVKDDYYCLIPNKLNDKIKLYVHFFPTDLYEYEMLEDLVSEYDLKELIESATITSNRYEQKFNDDGELIVQSTDSNSVTHYHDPNYKNYKKTTPTANQTEISHFPLSSRYRSNQNWEVPDLNTSNPQWKKTTTEAPYWQARIPFDNLNAPLNVFINYEYLPTSREYHQHYFGFEPTDMNNATNKCKTINVFEGTNVNILDEKFGSENNYRLINLGNPYDDSHSIYVPHENIIPIDMDFNEKIYNNIRSCLWARHQCKNYYIYTPQNTPNNQLGYCYKNINLTADHYYSLQYYIYIPSKVITSNDSCYIAVNVDGVDYKMDSAFIAKDKALRNQWIYHEVPFLAGTNNTIKIVGPQGSINGYENSVYFIYLQLQEMIEYSPTLQYGSTGLRITEQDKSVLKTQKEMDPCNSTSITPDNKTYNSKPKEFPKPYSNVNIVSKDEKYAYYDPYTTDLLYTDNIYRNIKIISSDNTVQKDDPLNITVQIDSNDGKIDNKEIKIYSTDEPHQIRQNGQFSPSSDKPIYYDNENGILHIPGDEDIQFRYDKTTTDLYVIHGEKLTGIYGPNNKFIFDFMTDDGEFVTDGKVEISILTQEDRDINNKGVLITRKPQTVNGHMIFDNIDLSNLQPNTSISNAQNKYYIRLIYTNKCIYPTDKPKIVFKTLYVYKEDAKINGIKINNTVLNINQTTHKIADYHINNVKQFPLKIEIQVTDQNNNIKTSGFCELSINDKMNQSTLLDPNGWADFYLTQDDLSVGRQTIKIEFYRKYNNSLAFIYFDIVVDSLDDLKDYVPIDIKVLDNGLTKAIPNNNIYEIGSDDCALSVINTQEHSKFRIEVYRSDNPNTPFLVKNIYNKNMQNTSFIHATWSEWQTHNSYTYRIVTGNMIDEHGNVVQDLYRDYERSFTIRKRTT